MKILIVTSCTTGAISPFVKEQVAAINKYNDVEFEYFLIRKKGIAGYFSEWLRCRNYIHNNSSEIDLVHAHYGLSGFLASAQRKIKTIITFHGSDINYWWHRFFSQLSIFLAYHIIFVSEELKSKVFIYPQKADVIPCGINQEYHVIKKATARKKLNWRLDDKYILFSSSFNRKEKNPELAFKVLDQLKKDFSNIKLIELSGYNRDEVNLLMCASDLLLLTSKSEGSPQVIKESIYFKLPIVSTDVGTIKKMTKHIDNVYVTNKGITALTKFSKKILTSGKRIYNNKGIEHFDNRIIAEKIYNIYKICTNELSH